MPAAKLSNNKVKVLAVGAENYASITEVKIKQAPPAQPTQPPHSHSQHRRGRSNEFNLNFSC